MQSTSLADAQRRVEAGLRHYRRGERSATRVEMAEALTQALACFSAAQHDAERAARWCAGLRDRLVDLRARVEAGGLDDLPPLEVEVEPEMGER